MLSLESRKKLAIGTAQFGYKYGVTNKRGKTSAKEISKIINLQRNYKINYLDTAQSYKSEKILKNLPKDLRKSVLNLHEVEDVKTLIEDK